MTKDEDKVSPIPCIDMPFYYNGEHGRYCEQEANMCKKCIEKYQKSQESVEYGVSPSMVGIEE